MVSIRKCQIYGSSSIFIWSLDIMNSNTLYYLESNHEVSQLDLLLRLHEEEWFLHYSECHVSSENQTPFRTAAKIGVFPFSSGAFVIVAKISQILDIFRTSI